MRRLISLLLVLMLLMTSVCMAERGSIELTDEELEPENEDELFGDDAGIVYDPVDELALDDVQIEEAFEKLDSVKNILLLGVDSRLDEFSGRSDTMILLTVDIDNKTIKMTSFLRDTYVEIPNHKNNRLNAAYAFGGADLLEQTLKKNFGVTVDAYVAVNLRGLVSVIDQLGGVYVDVDESKIDRVNAVIYWYNKQVLGLSNLRDGYITQGGYQLLTGKQAESWARYRYSESDMQRSARQRQLITIIFEMLCDMSVPELGSFAIANAKYVKTDMAISDIVTLAPAVLAMKDAEIRELQIPISGGYSSQTISEMSVLVPNRQKNINAIKEFLETP